MAQEFQDQSQDRQSGATFCTLCFGPSLEHFGVAVDLSLGLQSGYILRIVKAKVALRCK